jgi:formate/nitrite transporter
MEQKATNNFLSPPQIATVFADSAVLKASLSFPQFLTYAFLGGAFIALGGLLSLLVAGGMPGVAASNPGIKKFIAGAMFPVGLVLVVVAGAGIFTSDCATLPYAIWKGKLKTFKALQLGVSGYVANFAGALLVAWLLAIQTGTLVGEPWRSASITLALHKTHASFMTVFVKGIGANLMVCLAIWMAYAAKDITGKVILIWMPVMAFVALGWEHSIANMFFIPTAMFLGAPITIGDFLFNNLFPATLGNIIGGLVFVALPYWFIFKESAHTQKEYTNNIGHLPARQAEMPVLNKQLN